MYRKLLFAIILSFCLILTEGVPRAETERAPGKTYHVSQRAENASDENPGTADAPWLTIERATRESLESGDHLIIHDGVYRGGVNFVGLQGEAGNPIVIEGRSEGPGVVLKGSQVFKGDWQNCGKQEKVEEPYPNAYRRRWVSDCNFEQISQVILNDNILLQQIGQDPVETDPNHLPPVGRGVEDMIRESFYHDPEAGRLYVDVHGGSAPTGYTFEITTIPRVFYLEECRHVVVRNLEIRYGWMGLYAIHCENLLVENVATLHAAEDGIQLRLSKNCVIRNCKANGNGQVGLGLAACVDSRVENTEIFRNNYRRFHPYWHAGGSKNVKNIRCAFVGCTAGYNNGDGIWFDVDNQDIEISGNRLFHNEGNGVHYEISFGDTFIANNLIYSNRQHGVYVAASSGVTVAHNTLIENGLGVRVGGVPRRGCFPTPPGQVDVTDGGKLYERWGITDHQRQASQNRIYNNLFVRNRTVPGATNGTQAFFPLNNQYARENSSDFNIYMNGWWTPLVEGSAKGPLALEEWLEESNQDKHSRTCADLKYVLGPTGDFRWVDTEMVEPALRIENRLPEIPRDIDGKTRGEKSVYAGAQTF